MKTARLLCLLILTGVMLVCFSRAAVVEPQSPRAQYQKFQADGNFKEAYEGFRKLALDPADDVRLVGEDMIRGVQCLQRLNRSAEIDAFLEAVIEAHLGNWRLLHTAAITYMDQEHYG
ncbi:MAG TPA: hypothetical protein VE890_18175, partial [Thermoguttaceae bacterium]|nr:hypothetical protein [Thermoguttaceae bacterium]